MDLHLVLLLLIIVVPLAFQLIVGLLFGGSISLVGAFVGVLYPPRSSEWASLQKVAGLCFLLTLMLLPAGFLLIAYDTPYWLKVFSIAPPLATLLTFLIIGNACRVRHGG